MIGRASAQPRDDSRHVRPELQSHGSAARSAPASVAEEPDLETGLLPHPDTDSASALHNAAPDEEAPQPRR